MAVTAADNAAANAQLEDATGKAPAGVVLPPRDIRAIVEKTAGYVARNGAVFEDRIRQKEVNNAKFSFLSSHDAYYPFYAWRLDEVKQGRGTDVSAGRVGEASKEPEKPKGPEQPPDFHFSAKMPNISAQDLDVVKLTALFVAKNGRNFATILSQRESTSSQFDFLRPQHSIYQFFSRLVDQYTEILTGGDVDSGKPEKLRIAELERNAKNKFNVLERAKKRAEWVKYIETQKAKKEEEEEAEKLAFAQIDWHDFLIVETVLFTDADEVTELPPPTSLADLQSASLEQKANTSSLVSGHMRIEEAMPTDDGYQIPQAQMHPTYAPPPPASLPQRPYQESVPMPMMAPQQPPPMLAHPAPPQVKIREAAPRAMNRRKNVAMAKCPQCGENVPMDELEQHMKIELQDPQWRAQKAKSDARNATTNLSTADVANNLKRLASQRTDVFDPITGRPLNEEEAARLKKAATFSGDPADGVIRRPGETLSVEDQIKAIHERYGRT
ncbi:Surp module [Microthyrium microscopicum]|uniref:Surp module n=1 Tax=Microthyrium microscopicum TaxID=703497 RepID=A0A6A6UP78_9PEZI|nr:Surp module [Microthyrium microscopicum]